MTRDGSWLCAGFLACVVLLLPLGVRAQALPREVVQQRAQEVEHLFNWYYASVYGTGAYKIGEESVAVLRLPFTYTVRKPNEEQWGLKLTLPVSAAFAEFDLRSFDLGQLHTTGVSVLPGIEVEIPLSDAWTVRPFANVGGGWEFRSDSSAFIHAVGVSTLYRQPLGENVLSAVGGKFVHAGYRSGDEKSTLAALSVGGDLGFPLSLDFSGRQAVLGTQLIGTAYFNDLDMLLPASGTKEISYEAEVALTLGVRRSFEVLGVGFDRVGIGYRRGSNGLRGVRLVGSFPF